MANSEGVKSTPRSPRHSLLRSPSSQRTKMPSSRERDLPNGLEPFFRIIGDSTSNFHVSKKKTQFRHGLRRQEG